MEKKQQQFSLWYFMTVLLIFLAIQNFLFLPSVENLSYSDFKALLTAKHIVEVTIGEHRINGRVKLDGLGGILSEEKIKKLKQFGEGE